MSENSHAHAIVISDPDGRIGHWDDGAERLFGYLAVEAEGQSLDLIVPSEYRERHWEGFRRAMDTGECKVDRAATNLPVKCKDGTVRAFPARFIFLQDARGHVVGAMAIYADPEGSEQPSRPILGRCATEPCESQLQSSAPCDGLERRTLQ